MKRIYSLILLTSVLVSTLTAGASAKTEEPAVSASTDSYSILIGDRIRYVIEIKSKGDLIADLPKFPDNKIGDFEIKESGLRSKKGLFGLRALIYWYDLTVYTPGKHQIPPLEIRYSQKVKTEWETKKTPPINIIVGSVLPKGREISDIRDIKGPISFFEINWLLVLGGATILALCAWFFVAYKRRKARGPLRLPHETALEELEANMALLARSGDVKEYYVGISDCVRRYIERVFRLKAPEMTTEEFLNSLKESHALAWEQKDLLKAFLGACDMVKFAKYAPSRQEIESVFSAAKKFIEETREMTSPKTNEAR